MISYFHKYLFPITTVKRMPSHQTQQSLKRKCHIRLYSKIYIFSIVHKHTITCNIPRGKWKEMICYKDNHVVNISS